MAQKEATVYIVDCGSSMGERAQGRRESNLGFALQYVWDKITTTIATGRKTAMAGIVGLRTDGTGNMLDSEADYAHITVFEDISQVMMPQVRRLTTQLVVSGTNAGDAISSLVVAIQMISTTCKKLSFVRKIVLVTDGRGAMQADDLSHITKKLKDDNIQLVVLGVDFDDSEYGFKEENKDALKAENEEIFRQLCEDCNGTFGTLAQAVDELGIPRVKAVKPIASYTGFLTLGNPEEYETAMSINVERFPKTMVAAAPSASSFVLRQDMAAEEATQSTKTLNGDAEAGANQDDLSAVRNARTYQVEDENAPGGKRDVDLDELSKGYEYGRTAVHISESDRNVTTYETHSSLDIIGFVEKAQYEHYLDMSRSAMVIASRNNDKASMALSSLIHALYELESYAVARLVRKENTEPRIVLLAPNIEPDFECLYDVELPFAEDVRSYKFPPLDHIITVSGKVLKLHRNLPSDELQDAMSAYVDSMDLSSFNKDDEGEPSEYGPPDETFSPMLHRINQVVKHRAVHPNSDIPEPYEILTRYSRPPEELVKTSQPALDRVIKAADVKKVPPKARGKRSGRKDAPKPLSELDVGALLAQDPKRQQMCIDPRNAIPEFKQLIASTMDLETVQNAFKQLKVIVFDWIRHSVGDSGYGKSVEAIRVMREEALGMEEPGPFNEVLQELKSKLLAGELGGERRDMWFSVRVHRLGLIQKKECEASDVDEDAARTFMIAK